MIRLESIVTPSHRTIGRVSTLFVTACSNAATAVSFWSASARCAPPDAGAYLSVIWSSSCTRVVEVKQSGVELGTAKFSVTVAPLIVIELISAPLPSSVNASLSAPVPLLSFTASFMVSVKLSPAVSVAADTAWGAVSVSLSTSIVNVGASLPLPSRSRFPEPRVYDSRTAAPSDTALASVSCTSLPLIATALTAGPLVNENDAADGTDDESSV